MPKLVNWNLMRHPANWAIVILMVLIGGFGIDIAASGWKRATDPNA